MRAGGDGGHRVGEVVSSIERERAAARHRAPGVQIEGLPALVAVSGRGEPMRRSPRRVVTLHRVPRDGRSRACLHELHHVGVAGVRDHEPVLRDPFDEPGEGGVVARLVGVDVDVVVLDAGDDADLGAVVPELRGLVEERGVVLVAFDHERRLAARLGGIGHRQSRAELAPRWKLERTLEILGKPTDEKTRLGARVLEDPCAHRAGRRLAVGAGHDQGRGPGQDVLGQGPDHRRVRKARIDGGPRFGVVAATHVADHHQVRRRLEVVRRKALDQPHPPPLQRRSHRRVEGHVRPRHLVPGRLEQPRERPHARAGDGDEVDMHGRLVMPRRVRPCQVGGSQSAMPRCTIREPARAVGFTLWPITIPSSGATYCRTRSPQMLWSTAMGSPLSRR